jgi:hypothetical protein
MRKIPSISGYDFNEMIMIMCGFVLDQHSELDLYITSSLKQQYPAYTSLVKKPFHSNQCIDYILVKVYCICLNLKISYPYFDILVYKN